MAENNTIEKQAEQFQRRALVDPSTVDADGRTFVCEYATDTPVLRSPWFGESYYEVLSMDGMRTGRMDKGAPFLDNHERFGKVTENVLGVVLEHWQEGTARYAKIKLSQRAVDSGLMADIQDGILRNVSVGYRVYKYTEKPRAEGEDISTFIAEDWEAMEVSAVAVGADENAGIRAEANAPTNTILIQRAEGPAKQKPQKMQENPKDEGARTTPAPQDNTPETRGEMPAATPNVEEVRRLERERASAIYKRCELLGLERTFADGLVAEGVELEAAMQRAFEAYEKNDPAKGVANTQMEVKRDERDSERELMQGALLARSAARNVKLSDAEKEGARLYRSTSLLELAKRSLERSGIDYNGMPKMDIAGRAITQSTSDLPVILEGTLRRILLSAYENSADTWNRFCLQGTVSDFREHKRLRAGTFARLDKVLENAEYRNQAIPDAELERIKAETYGNTINVSRQMIVNDDLGYFTRLAGMLGRAAARSIEVDVYALLAENSGLGPIMEDGLPMFDAAHNNIDTTGASPSVDSFERMRVLMASQKDPAGNEFIDLRPEVGVFGLSTGGEARVVNDAQYDPNATNKLQKPNKVRGLLADIVDTPRISGSRYYMFNVADDPAIEVAFLDGQTSPYLESRMGWEVDGMEWKVRLDYGVSGISWRGAVTNAGA